MQNTKTTMKLWKKPRKDLFLKIKGGKGTHLGAQLFRGEGGGHSQKEGIFFDL